MQTALIFLRRLPRVAWLTGFICGVTVGQAHASAYLLLEGGKSYADLTTQSFDRAAAAWLATPTATSAQVSSDDSHTQWRLGAGYAFSKQLAVELYYEDLGDYQAAMNLNGTDGQGAAAQLNATEAVNVSGVGAQLVGQWPLTSHVSLLGTAGVAYLENERRYDASVTNFDAPTQISDANDDSHTWVPTLGVGAQLAITEQLSLRGRYTRYFDAGETDNLPGFDLDMISAGLTWQW
ncbi:outer membrane protein [Halomonas llamarensis]|uniref:Porin family protein n=1 Tax=Halomonas llamarensis TaxID=2945104 RepID=A0ABT0SQV8_9GAMM|nr:outer membrane beta-barrel protein [Halomonas llamarensis]MCL7930209.1 porin family protein [Halomonas llamarensis]